MGIGISNNTSEVNLKGNVLYVWLTSSSLRQELSYGKAKIVQLINEKMGEEVVKKIVFL